MFFPVIFLLGSIHGLVLAGLLASKRINRLSNRLLGGLMMVFTLDLAMAAFFGFDAQEKYPHLIGLDFTITLLYGPFLYLYTQTLISSEERLGNNDWFHFVPFLLLNVYMLPFYMSPGHEKLTMLNGQSGLDYGFDFIPNLKILFNLVYIPFIIGMIYSYRKRLKDNYSTIEKRNLNWLQGFIFGGVLLAVAAVVLHLMNWMYGADPLYVNLTLLGVTVYVYSIGYMGLKQPEFFSDFGNKFTKKQNQYSESSESYSKSGLDDIKGRELMEELVGLMENQKPYTDNELSLRDLAEMMKVSSHNLTEIINKHAGKSFYDFVNSYRVEEVKKRISDNEAEKLTLLSIGMDAGFNSKSSFNSVFKKHTGMTPTQFRQSLKKAG